VTPLQMAPTAAAPQGAADAAETAEAAQAAKGSTVPLAEYLR
jgi:hypothetical protein